MRNLVIMGMLTAGAFMAGWFTIERQGDRTTIEINKNEIRDDTRNAIVRGRDLLERVEQPGDAGEAGRWDTQVPQQQSYAQPAEQIAQQPQWQQQPTWQNDPRYSQPANQDYAQPVTPGAYQYQQPYAQPQQPR